MVVIHQGNFIFTLTLKKYMSSCRTSNVKQRATRLTSGKFKIDRLNYWTKNLYSEALLEIYNTQSWQFMQKKRGQLLSRVW